MSTALDNYYSKLAKIESNRNPLAYNPASGASGLYQFTPKTWEGLGLGGFSMFDVGAQNKGIQILTQQNANALMSSGLPVTNENLYATHFLGAPYGTKVLGAPDNVPISSLVPPSFIKANPQLESMTVGDFKGWTGKLFGGFNSGDNQSGNVGGSDILGAILNPAGAIADFQKSLQGGGGSFFTNVTFVVIGAALIILAIAAFILTSDTGKKAVSIAGDFVPGSGLVKGAKAASKALS